MKVLFADDGSESAARAQRLVRSINWPAPTVIKAVRADQLLIDDVGMSENLLTATHDRLQQQMQLELATTRLALTAPGRTVETALVMGRPASVIVDQARRMSADLIVVGNHGRGAFASALLGSVANEVVDHAPCPVLVSRTETIGRVVLASDGTAGALQ